MRVSMRPRRPKAPSDPVSATEASTATRCARQYYLEYVACVPVDRGAAERRRAGTVNHLAYTQATFGVGRVPHARLRAVIRFVALLAALALAWFALRAVGLLP